MRNYLVTGFNGGDVNVLIYTEKFSATTIRERLTKNGYKFNKIIELCDDELQYYCIDDRVYC